MLTTLTTYKYCLPQGSPASPITANLVLRDFDDQINNFAKNNRAFYSRFGDDILISANKPVDNTFITIKTTLRKHGLKINESKNYYFDTFQKRKSVLGLIINKKLNIPKKERKLIRAMIFNLKEKEMKDPEKLIQSIKGKLIQVKILHPNLADKMAKQIENFN